MTSFNINDIFVKEEHDIASHPKVIQLLFSGVNSKNTIVHESNVLQYPICDGVQVKQETNNMGNVELTTAVCNNVLNHVKLEQTVNAGAAGEHFIGECDYCNKMFDCRLSLVKHIHNHIIQESCKTCYVPLHRTSIKCLHVCSVCNKCFKQSSYLKAHKLTHTNVHNVGAAGEHFIGKCDYCNKMFDCRLSLVKHIHNHIIQESCKTCYVPLHRTSIKCLHVCSVCNKCFKQSRYLKAHKLTHTNERPHECNVCNKFFRYRSNLISHKLTHTNERPHECNVCNKFFRFRSSLISHKLTHTNERPHECNVCNKFFRQRSHCIRHKLTHTNERPHECNVCNKSFRNRSNLIRHKLTHTNERPHECNVCNKSFRNRSNLIRHKLTHTNVRPHECNVCNKFFRYRSNLISHKLTHTNERPHECNVCMAAICSP